MFNKSTSTWLILAFVLETGGMTEINGFAEGRFKKVCGTRFSAAQGAVVNALQAARECRTGAIESQKAKRIIGLVSEKSPNS